MCTATMRSLSLGVFCLIILIRLTRRFFFFFFNDTATTEIYTLSLHDALPISQSPRRSARRRSRRAGVRGRRRPSTDRTRSEEHTSELQSPCNLVCRLLLEKKKTKTKYDSPPQ